MRGIGLVSIKQSIRQFWMAGLAAVLMTGCSTTRSDVPVRALQIQQTWELQPGDAIAGFGVEGGLGDISIALDGATIYAPFDGEFQPNDLDTCFIYSSPEVPAYLFRLCGVRALKLGMVSQGTAIAKGDQLQFAALRRQPDGTWAMVEPSRELLERMLNQS